MPLPPLSLSPLVADYLAAVKIFTDFLTTTRFSQRLREKYDRSVVKKVGSVARSGRSAAWLAVSRPAVPSCRKGGDPRFP